MSRRTDRAFARLALVMTGGGLTMGAIFPFAAVLLGLVPADHAFGPQFVVASLGAGVFVGLANFAMARRIVGRSASRLARSMHNVAASMTEAAYTGDRAACDLASCSLPVAPDDEIGEAASAFNALLRALERSRTIDDQVRAFGGVVGEAVGLRKLGASAVEAILPLTDSYGGALCVLTDDGVEVVATAGEGSQATMASLISRNDLNSTMGVSRVPYGDGIEAILAPVRVREEVVAMLLLEGPTYLAGAESHIGLYLPALGLGVAAALSRERLERAAERDALTGIRNRRAGSAALGHALDMARASDSSIGVILVDLDHFKKVNDTFGHPAGDQVLIAAARAMASVLRGDDILARYGGEEFLVVCPGADRRALELVGERLRAAVAEKPGEHDGQAIPITASIGGAALGEIIAGSAEALIGTADQALYAAKRAGRNRVMLAPEMAIRAA